jgi:hypothetical protein
MENDGKGQIYLASSSSDETHKKVGTYDNITVQPDTWYTFVMVYDFTEINAAASLYIYDKNTGAMAGKIPATTVGASPQNIIGICYYHTTWNGTTSGLYAIANNNYYVYKEGVLPLPMGTFFEPEFITIPDKGTFVDTISQYPGLGFMLETGYIPHWWTNNAGGLDYAGRPALSTADGIENTVKSYQNNHVKANAPMTVYNMNSGNNRVFALSADYKTGDFSTNNFARFLTVSGMHWDGFTGSPISPLLDVNNGSGSIYLSQETPYPWEKPDKIGTYNNITVAPNKWYTFIIVYDFSETTALTSLYVYDKQTGALAGSIVDIEHGSSPAAIYAICYVKLNWPDADSTIYAVANNRYYIQGSELPPGDLDSTVLTINAQNGREYNMAITVSNVSSFANTTFTIQYDPSKLQLVDFAAQTRGTDTSAGKIAGTDLEILSVDTVNGMVTFRVNRTLLPGRKWSGVLTVIRFKALVTDVAAVTFE